MRDEGLGSKPLAEAVQAVLLDSLNMKTDLEVLEPRVFRERLWKQDLQFVWIRWFMDYPDPHNEYFDTFYGKKTTGRRQAWVNDAFDKELEAGRDTRDPKKRLEHYKKAEEIMQQDVGYVPVAWVVRYAAKKPWVAGIEKNKAGEFVVDGNIYVDMLAAHLHHREGLVSNMRRGIRAARVALFVMAGLMLGAGVAAAQVDLAKVLVGTWKGELQQRTQKDADPTLVLIINSVKQEDGKWVASARVGATEEKTRSVNLEIDATGSKPSVRWTAGSGTTIT